MSLCILNNTRWDHPSFSLWNQLGCLQSKTLPTVRKSSGTWQKWTSKLYYNGKQEHQYYYSSDYTYNEASGREHEPAAFISLCIHLPSRDTFYGSFFRVWVSANVVFNMLCIFPYSVSLCGNISILPSSTSSVITVIITDSSMFLSWFYLFYFFGFRDYISLDFWKKAMFWCYKYRFSKR